MSRLIAVLVAVTFAVGAMALPADAAVNTYRADGWHVVKMNQKQATVTLRDRTPAKTWVRFTWTKKPGPTKCRAKVTFVKGGVRAWAVLEKYSRAKTSRWTGWLTRGGRTDKTIKTTITTNGRCIIWAAVK
jgi:hypothetical protein